MSRLRRHRRIATEIAAARHALRALDRALSRVAPVLTAGTTRNGPVRRSRFSSRARASLILQGRYIGYLRQLKPRQKTQVRRIREAKGVRAAIAIARYLSKP